jgi:hypothetical protein
MPQTGRTRLTPATSDGAPAQCPDRFVRNPLRRRKRVNPTKPRAVSDLAGRDADLGFRHRPVAIAMLPM